MSEMTIQCPHCGEPFELNAALAAPLLESQRKQTEADIAMRIEAERAAIAKKATEETAAQFTGKLRAAEAEAALQQTKLAEAQKAELAARKEREQLEQEKRLLDLTVQRRVDEQLKAATVLATEVVAKDMGARLCAAEALAAEKDAKLAQAQQAELEALKAKREAEEAKREIELQVARQLEAERAKVRDQAIRERDDEYRLKMADKDKQIADMQQKLEEARRTGDSTSQQLTGEVMELDLYEILSASFPNDEFDRTKKGQAGGDVIQTVRNRLGQPCGKIIWESKRTKAWSDTWLVKLREDQRNAKADVAALMTETLPEGIRYFGTKNDVWVTSVPTVIPMAIALRQGLIETANARRAAAGTDAAKDLVYSYLTGLEFCQRVRGALEPIIQMRDDHESEKRITTKRWSAREKQIDRFMNSMAGMYGDLQGLVGPGLPDVEGLTLLEHNDSSDGSNLDVANPDTLSAPGSEEDK